MSFSATSAAITGSLFSPTTVTSVLAPGVCLSAAGTFAFVRIKIPENTWVAIRDYTASISAPLAIILGLVLLSFSYICGYASRALAFWIIGTLSRHQRFAPPNATEMLLHLRHMYGNDRTETFLRNHKDLSRWLDNPPDFPISRAGGGHRADWGFRSFSYCKSEIRRRSPESAVDDTEREMEINMLASFLMPLLFLFSLIIWAAHTTPLPSVLLVTICCALCIGVTQNIIRLRENERYATLENLADLTLRAIPAAPPTSPPPSSVTPDGQPA
jgi:hypothetical protein